MLWLFLIVIWLLVWGPDVKHAWDNRSTRNKDLDDLRRARCVEDMFGERK